MHMKYRLYKPDRTEFVRTLDVDRAVRDEVVIGTDGGRYELDTTIGDHRGTVPVFDYVRERTLFLSEVHS